MQIVGRHVGKSSDEGGREKENVVRHREDNMKM